MRKEQASLDYDFDNPTVVSVGSLDRTTIKLPTIEKVGDLDG